MHGNFFFVQYAHSFGKKKALLNKNMYVYSKSVLPAYLITKKRRRRKGILKTRTIISVLRRFKFLQ